MKYNVELNTMHFQGYTARHRRWPAMVERCGICAYIDNVSRVVGPLNGHFAALNDAASKEACQLMAARYDQGYREDF